MKGRKRLTKKGARHLFVVSRFLHFMDSPTGWVFSLVSFAGEFHMFSHSAGPGTQPPAFTYIYEYSCNRLAATRLFECGRLWFHRRLKRPCSGVRCRHTDRLFIFSKQNTNKVNYQILTFPESEIYFNVY